MDGIRVLRRVCVTHLANARGWAWGQIFFSLCHVKVESEEEQDGAAIIRERRW